MKKEQASTTIAENRKARHNYIIEDTFECGIALKGSEVKSLRAHHVSFSDAYAIVKNGEVLLLGLRIEKYKQATHEEIDPERTRTLLLHRKEITRLERTLSTKKMSLIPLKIYLKNGRIKVLLGLGVGARAVDKRANIKDRETKIELSRVLKRG